MKLAKVMRLRIKNSLGSDEVLYTNAKKAYEHYNSACIGKGETPLSYSTVVNDLSVKSVFYHGDAGISIEKLNVF